MDADDLDVVVWPESEEREAWWVASSPETPVGFSP